MTDKLTYAQMNEKTAGMVTQMIGEFKLKDQPGKDNIVISNNGEEYSVVKAVVIEKVKGSNRIRVHMIMPDPETVEVIKKEALTTQAGLPPQAEMSEVQPINEGEKN